MLIYRFVKFNFFYENTNFSKLFFFNCENYRISEYDNIQLAKGFQNNSKYDQLFQVLLKE